MTLKNPWETTKNSTAVSRKPASALATYVIFAILLSALLLGIALVAASWAPFSQVQRMLERQYGPVLTARRLTQEFYEQKQHLARLIGILCLFMSGAI
jgi:hypothetical protein